MLKHPFVDALARGEEVATPPDDLMGRVVQIYPNDRLEDGELAKGKRTAWASGGEALALFSRMKHREFLLATGQSVDWLEKKRKGQVALYFVAFRRVPGRLATWDAVRAVAEEEHPAAAAKLAQWWTELAKKPLTDLVPDWKELSSDAIKGTPTDPRHLNTERYVDAPDDAYSARVFLMHTLGVNELFTGNGRTAAPSGVGYEEFIIRNARLADLEHHAVLLNYRQ